jgi:hypothetical protein
MGVLQTCAAKRGETRFNWAAWSLSGSESRRSLGEDLIAEAAVAKRLRTNPADHFFELDSRTVFVHNDFTSQLALQPAPAKLMFAGSLAAACKSSDPVDLHKNLSPHTGLKPAVCSSDPLFANTERAKGDFHDFDS